MLLVYDHLITLDMEVEWIWTLPWRLPTIIFILNRYVITSLVMLNTIPNLIYFLPVSFCDFYYNITWVPLLNFSAAELLLIIRVCSLYEHRKLVVWPLRCFYAVAVIAAIFGQVLYRRDWYTASQPKFFPGCLVLPRTSTISSSVAQWHVWVTYLSFEGVLVLLTVYKLRSYRRSPNRIITVLARDSIVYFIVVFVCLALLVLYDLLPSVNINFRVACQCVVSVAVGRMMMNLRALRLDNPKYTLHQQTGKLATSSSAA